MSGTTSQQAFHPMRGHINDGQVIHMDNGDTLTLAATLRGWQLMRNGEPYKQVMSSAAEIERAVVNYPQPDK